MVVGLFSCRELDDLRRSCVKRMMVRKRGIMRLDKYLKNSRIIKRRTVAKEACEAGRIQVNGKVAKPGVELRTGDEIVITFGNSTMKVRVEELIASPRKEDAEKMYTVIQ